MELNLQQFGGRGSSNPQGGGNGFEKKGATSLKDGSSTIDLSGSPLRFGKDDARIREKLRAGVEEFEEKYRGSAVEYGATFNENGYQHTETRGTKTSVKISTLDYDMADTYSHIHPREEGILGGTFSETDLSHFAKFHVKTCRAAAKEGTYSISKGKNFDSTGFGEFVKREFGKVTSEAHKTATVLNRKINTMQYETYSQGIKDINNKMLVGLHNVLISGQKQFGYKYTLERRK